MSRSVAGLQIKPAIGPSVGTGMGSGMPPRSEVKLAGKTGSVSTIWQHSMLAKQLSSGIVRASSRALTSASMGTGGGVISDGGGATGAGFAAA